VKIAVVTHFYPPEPCAAATRVSSLVEALARAGHEVTVVTNFASFPSGRFARGERFVAKKTESSSHASVVRLSSLIVRGIPGARLVHWGSSALASTLFLLVSKTRYDGIVVSLPPITLALPALVGAWRHRARLVVDVRDVFPDIAIAMGEWKRDGVLARASEWLVRKLYKRADLIVAVTPTALAQIAERGVDPSRLMLARNAAEIVSQPSGVQPRQNGFTAIYAGNLGLATDVDILADAAALLRGDNVTIEIVGDGAQRAHLDDRVRDEALDNVVVKGSIPRADAMRLVAQADVSIVPLRKGIRESVPTKLYDAFSVGCPVVVAAEGEASSEGAELGAVCVDPGDAAALADALRRLSRLDRDALRELGTAGKARVQNRADRAGIMEALAGRISRLA
jgi:glycosyltransferase involved in cell wall biosynthesis